VTRVKKPRTPATQALQSARPGDAAPSRHERVDRQGFAMGGDDTPIYYRVFGAAEGPTVVLTDGIGCDGYIWKYLERELAEDHRVVRWHYRGHGRTPPPRDPRRVEIVDLAEDLFGVLDAGAGEDEPAILIGHSMGVQVCLEARRRNPDRVRGLVLVCGSYGTPLRTFKGQRTLEQLLPFISFTIHRIPGVISNLWRTVLPTELAYQMATKLEINGQLIRREDFFPYLEHMAQVDVRLWVKMLTAAGHHSARDLLEHIDVPTLIVSGERDGFTPPSLSEEMQRLIPESELFVVEGGSHTAPIERPAEVARRVREFLRDRLP
jgi:pimeloyl-ACP methyl ester carboxylesterase